MKKHWKAYVNHTSTRILFVVAAMLVQLAVLGLTILQFNQYFIYFYAVTSIASLAIALYVVNSRSNPGYKIAWIILIMFQPIFGGLFYLMFGNGRPGRKVQKKLSIMDRKMQNTLGGKPSVQAEIDRLDPSSGKQSHYIAEYGHCPAYRGTSTEYLTPGEMKFERLKQDLQKAEHFIFLEYFIIEEGIMWDSILDILRDKAQKGVDVRVIYDDIGSLITVPYHYNKELEKMGIQCCVFNPLLPVLSARLNNRDHRKIAVIDGAVGYTGGINLADEYINAIEKHGHWKDSSIRLEGGAVWSLTVMFLTLWDYLNKCDENYEAFRRQQNCQIAEPDAGFVQPFCDSPLDGESVGETVYMNIISRAKRYVYITTPYLVLDNEIMTALCNAAKQGVDVRITTPHIWDHWYVRAVSRGSFQRLIENGVKIYEYTPGFIHAKTFVADDEIAVVGTINLDYRSLYLHFECGIWMYRTPSVAAIRKDYDGILNLSQQVTLEDCHRVKWYHRIGRSILYVFAPLM